MAQNYQFLWINILISIIFLSKLANSQLDSRPNIILIVTDDQDVVLHGLLPMEATQKHIGLKGMTFMNAYTSSPMCCPSRASILSGQYAHNHATINNSESGGCYGDFWRNNVELRTFPVFLQFGGYQTFFAGKYLNEYFDHNIPRGWDHFYGLHGNSRYYNYSLTENGKVVFYDDEYLTDVLNERIIEFLRNQTQETNEHRPFFAMITPPAPHAPYTSAPRHKETFKNVKALRTPNFNLVSGPLDKHWLVAMGSALSEPILETLDLYYRKRWQSLMAVDELIESIIDELETSGEINNTYLIFTSDNGYHIGQFAQPFDKRQPYETDVRVPFLIRGPNIPEKSIANVPIALIDIFPTILDWAQIPQPGYEDGISINKYLENNYNMPSNLIKPDKLYHRQILIEHWGEGNEKTFNPKCPWKRSDNLAQCTPDADCHCQDTRNNTYSCIRHFGYNIDKLYCEFQDTENFVEAYDLSIDPYQITNLGYELLPSERALYSIALDNLKHCTGENCRETKILY